MSFKSNVIELSEANDFNEAMKEWKLINLYRSDHKILSVTGRDISNVCILENRKTGKKIPASPGAAAKFLDKNFTNLFKRVNEVAEGSSLTLNKEIIEIFYNLGLLDDNEYIIYKQNAGAKKLEPFIKEKIDKLHKRFFKYIKEAYEGELAIENEDIKKYKELLQEFSKEFFETDPEMKERQDVVVSLLEIIADIIS